MSDKHHKHPPLVKPAVGEYGRFEIGILGAKCSLIQELATKLSTALDLQRSVYVDAEHGEGESASSFFSEMTDKINFNRLDSQDQFDKFSRRPLLNNSDLIFVNGNHFHASHQLVLIDSKKYDSVKRKVERLSHVIGFVLTDEESEVHDFLVQEESAKALPVLHINDVDAIAQLIKSKVMKKPALKGLILAGGKSRRMGQDKGSIELHGTSQREHMVNLVSPFVEEVYISCRPDQEEELKPKFNTIHDRLVDMGPFGAIVSAFMSDPDAAWLVLAIDLPNFGKDALTKLVTNRDHAAVATSYISPDSGFPEPLAAIWEPKSYLHLLQFLNQGYSCPRKVLINSGNTHLIHADSEDFLHNMNTPADLEKVREKL